MDELLDAGVNYFVDTASKGYFIGRFSSDLNVTSIVYLFQPFPLLLKDIVVTAISLSHMGTTPVFLTVVVFPLS